MSDDTTEAPTPKDRAHLRVVSEPVARLEVAAAGRPRTIGRLIAQTALIADSAATRSRIRTPSPGGGDARDGRGPRGFFSRFR